MANSNLFIEVVQSSLQLGIICHNSFENIPMYTNEQLDDMNMFLLKRADELFPNALPTLAKQILIKRTLEAYKRAHITNNNKTVVVANGCCKRQDCLQRLYVEAILLAMNK